MATISFFARGDSATANNSYLNATGNTQVPTTELVFDSGDTGDLVLDYNGGAVDPDTTVWVNGVEHNFTVEFSGTLPHSNKLSDVNGEDLRGEPITVVTIAGQRYFFLENGASLATMDAFPNGAHAIQSYDTTTDVPVCFTRGVLIRTPEGEVPVETLTAGDLVETCEGNTRKVRWVSSRKVRRAELILSPEKRPVCIAADRFGPGMPESDLWLSPQHRVLVSGWQVELLFHDQEVFVAAKHLSSPEKDAEWDLDGGVEYYHILLDTHEAVVSNGMATESFFPGDEAVVSLRAEQRAEMQWSMPELGGDWGRYGPLSRQAINGAEARVLREFAGLEPLPVGDPLALDSLGVA